MKKLCFEGKPQKFSRGPAAPEPPAFLLRISWRCEAPQETRIAQLLGKKAKEKKEEKKEKRKRKRKKEKKEKKNEKGERKREKRRKNERKEEKRRGKERATVKSKDRTRRNTKVLKKTVFLKVKTSKFSRGPAAPEPPAISHLSSGEMRSSVVGLR